VTDSTSPCLILASQSPRRRELLATAGIPFTVRVTPVPEIRREGETPTHYVRRLAHEKATASWLPDALHAGEIILGADTVVVVDEQVLEKPKDATDARRMLELLSGREHTVVTGICLKYADGAISDHAETTVRFAHMTADEIDDYIQSGEPLDKAGAYAIQGLASKFVERIDGCFFNVVGLPVSLVYRHWKALLQD
jgi:septum formation protein